MRPNAYHNRASQLAVHQSGVLHFQQLLSHQMGFPGKGYSFTRFSSCVTTESEAGIVKFSRSFRITVRQGRVLRNILLGDRIIAKDYAAILLELFLIFKMNIGSPDDAKEGIAIPRHIHNRSYRLNTWNTTHLLL